MDQFGRHIDYLRISITERCNERCLYCRPETLTGWRPKPDGMTNQEVLRVVRVAAALGFRKFRLTGGEPLVREQVPELVAGMAAIDGVHCVGLSTNGTRLAELAKPLKEAGLRTVNVSLDTLDPQRYRRLTGGELEPVLRGIHAALQAGFERIKINTVLLRGKNEEDIWPLIQFAAEHQLPLRLIELMPVTKKEVLDPSHFLSVEEVMDRLRQRETLVPLPQLRLGHGPAKYYRLEKTGAVVGFIGALTKLDFCDTCNKLRLSADGKIRPCLGHHGEIDLREALRPEVGDDALRTLFEQAMAVKPRTHDFRDSYQPCRPMTAIGG